SSISNQSPTPVTSSQAPTIITSSQSPMRPGAPGPTGPVPSRSSPTTTPTPNAAAVQSICLKNLELLIISFVALLSGSLLY
ncbi:33592_t:CDS:2, partial [Racocetra persica]